MRVNYAGQLGQTSSSLSPDVVVNVNGTLILNNNPSGPLEASTKQYVDTASLNLDASKLKEGTLPTERFPAFTGEVVSATGTGTFNLASTGIAEGTYTKVTVNAKGIVIGTNALTNEDIPIFDWSKVASDKPTTLDGYGITDGVSNTGGTLLGTLSLNNDPIDALDAVNKQYVDIATGQVTDTQPGDIIRRITNEAVPDFLRCNGGEVSKTTYAALYSVIGDIYSTVNVSRLGGGKPWSLQYDINTTQTNDVTGWSVTGNPVLPTGITEGQAIVTNNKVYVLGGRNAQGSSAYVYRGDLNASGVITEWVDNRDIATVQLYGTGSTTTPSDLTTLKITAKGGDGGSDSVVTLTGTSTGTIPSGVINVSITGKGEDGVTEFHPGGKPWKMQYDINTEQSGDITGWTTGTSLPVTLAHSQAIVTKNRVYLLGGFVNGAGYTSTVCTAPINADGTLGSWGYGTALPGPVGHSQAIVTKNRVYLLGGFTGSGFPYLSTVYTAPINADGTLGSWGYGTSLPVEVAYSQAIVTKNRVYLLGGWNSSDFISTVYTAPINADGTLGSWTTGTSLPDGLAYSQAVVTKNRVYLLGGGSYTNGNYSSTVYTAPINTDGTLGSWTTGTSLPGVVRNSQAIVTKNRVYLLGGDIGNSSSTVYTAPILGGLNDYSSYYDGITTTGASSTVTIDGTTHTFPGGVGGPATQTIKTQTLPGTSSVSYSHVIPTKGLGSLSYKVYTNVTTNLTNTGSGTIPAGITSVSITGKGGAGEVYQSGTQYGNPYIYDRFELYIAALSVDNRNIRDNGPFTIVSSTVTLPGSSVYCNPPPYKGNFNITNKPFNSISIFIKSSSTNVTYALNWSAPRDTFIFSYQNNTGAEYKTAGFRPEVPISVVSDTDGFWSTQNQLKGNVTGSLTIRYNASVVPAYVTTTGSSTTITINGTTHTFPGGVGGPATQSTKTQTLTGTSAVSYTYTVPSTGSAKLDYQALTPSNGENTVITVNGSSYTFPGGVGQPATEQTQTITLNGTDAASISYSVPFNGEAKLEYLDTESSITFGKILPGALSRSNAVVTKNKVYLIGGYSTTSVSSVYSATVNTDGTLSGWEIAASALPVPVSNAHAIVTNNKVYVIGGLNDTTPLSTIYSADMHEDGTIYNWVKVGDLPFTLYDGQIAVTKNKVFLFGGVENGTVSSKVYMAYIQSDGSLTNFEQVTSLPEKFTKGQCFVSNNKVYLFAGYNGTTVTNKTLIGAINVDGTITSWTSSTSSTALASGMMVATNGKLNVIGGHDASNVHSDKIYSVTISGSLNNYAPYYDGTVIPTQTPTFRVPDLTVHESENEYYFIKA